MVVDNFRTIADPGTSELLEAELLNNLSDFVKILWVKQYTYLEFSDRPNRF